MDVEIDPEPTPAEREALLAALELERGKDEAPAAYRSAWRRAALEQDGEEDAS